MSLMPGDYRRAPYLVYGSPTPKYVDELYRIASETDDKWDWRAANIAYWTLVERVESAGHCDDPWMWRLEAAKRVDQAYGGPGAVEGFDSWV